tara:strand:- start:1181 stop:2008 length:828 start_codon:yes stop_codon:yes gene_type:complete
MRNNQRRTGQHPDSTPSSSSPKTQMAFTTPTEFVELPSCGEFYSEDHPLYKQETIEIRFMTAKDEDILTSEALLKKGLAVDRLLENLLIEDVDPSTLLVGDRSALIIAARISAYGSEYKVSIRCKECFTINEILFDLKTASLRETCFDKEFLREEGISFNKETQTFDLVLPTSGVTVGLKLLDGKAEKKLSEKDNDKNRVTSLLSMFLVKVEESADFDTVMDFVDAMPAKDSKYLRSILPKLTPAVDLLQMHRCENCLHLEEMEVPLSAGFFWPE